MNRRRPDPRQIDLFSAPAPVRGPAALAGYGQRVSAAIGAMLKHDERSREEISVAMSTLLGEEVSAMMLDGYSSPARDQFNVSLHRVIALIAVTGQHELIEEAVGLLGGRILWGEEIVTAELGHINAEITRLQQRQRQLAASAKPISRGGTRR